MHLPTVGKLSVITFKCSEYSEVLIDIFLETCFKCHKLMNFLLILAHWAHAHFCARGISCVCVCACFAQIHTHYES